MWLPGEGLARQVCFQLDEHVSRLMNMCHVMSSADVGSMKGSGSDCKPCMQLF